MSMQTTQFSLTHEEIEKLCKAGGMAPSGGNAQPWNVIVDQAALTIKLDKKRSESFLDVGHYASFFGIGCFLENLLIEAETLGLQYTLQMHEWNSIIDPLVTITFVKREKTDIHELQPYIEKRITNRHIYNGSVIDQTTISLLQTVIDNKDFQLSTVSSFDGKEKIANTLGEADAIRMLNTEAYEEMMHEFRWSEEEVVETKDGLDLKTLELPKNAGKLYKLIKDYQFLPTILPRKALSEMARPLLIGCSHICCLSLSKELTPQTMLLAGRLFEKLWLTTTKLGIALQPWSIVPFFLVRLNQYEGKGFSAEEKETLRFVEKELVKLFSYSSNTPVFIFRLSLTDKVPSAHSLRIPWTDFTKIIS